MHSGSSHYYLKEESEKQRPEFGRISEIEKLIRSFPKVSFIAGHAGLFWQGEVRKRLKDCQNVWVDTSFQPPSAIKKLVKIFGAEKVMYASDRPWGFGRPHQETVKRACKGDRSLEKMIFFDNAADLLKICNK